MVWHNDRLMLRFELEMLSDYYSKNICLKLFNVSFCIYVVYDELSSMDWSPLHRLHSRCDDSMQTFVGWVGNALYLIFSCFSHQLPKSCIFGMLKHVHYKSRQLTVTFLENQLNCCVNRCCWNVYKSDIYEHVNERKK